jgi:hypothetical protein
MFQKIFTWANGRSTAFAAFFTCFGSLLAWFNKLTPTYIALVTAIQGYVVLHSVKEDYFAKKVETVEKHEENNA